METAPTCGRVLNTKFAIKYAKNVFFNAQEVKL